MFEKYDSRLPYSYVFGAFGTIKLLEDMPSVCIAVLVDFSFLDNEAYKKIVSLANKYDIDVIIDDNNIRKIVDKDNIYVVGVFKKTNIENKNSKHIVLDRCNDIGKIGTIIRSMQGFGFDNLILVNSDVDIYHYHLVRATMGSYFTVNIKKYDDISSYINDNKDKKILNVYTEGKDDVVDDLGLVSLDNVSIIFSKDKIEHHDVVNYKFEYNISLDNIVNIILFKMYEQ